MRLKPGDRILHGKYQIDRLLGGGGSADVYLAAYGRLNAKRAIKILRPDRATDAPRLEELRRRFDKEGSLQEEFRGHPRFIQIFEADDHEDLQRDGSSQRPSASSTRRETRRMG